MSETVLNIEFGQVKRDIPIRKVDGEWVIRLKDLGALGDWNPLVSVYFLIRAMREAMKK